MEKLTIADVKTLLKNGVTSKQLEELKKDTRKGVQIAITSYEKRLAKIEQQKSDFKKRLEIENDYWQNGIEYVAGVDEVGRGPLAGPVVSAAVVLPHDFDLYEVNDSKQLSEKTRERLYRKILEKAVSVGIGITDNHQIDEINIYQASRVAMKNAILNLNVTPQRIIVDAMDIDVPIQQLKLIKGDAKSASVSSASIVAKVVRDHLMEFYDKIYPGYDFKNNAGYGTKKHLAGLEEKGLTPIHRKTFEPVRKLI